MIDDDYKYTIKIIPRIDHDRQTLEMETYMNGAIKQVYKEYIDFKEKVVRDALISLGWKPPEDIK